MNARAQLQITLLEQQLQRTQQALDDCHETEAAAVSDVGRMASEIEMLKQKVKLLELENGRLKADIEELKEKA